MTQGLTKSLLLATTTLSVLTAVDARASDTLSGFALLPADTFAEGNTSGQQLSLPRNRPVPFPGPNGQPVQGFSGVQFAPGSRDAKGPFWFLSDNGYGGATNSDDYLLRLYQVDPNFNGFEGGNGSVEVQGFIQLSDPNNLIPWDIVADQQFYGGTNIPVDPAIKNNRLLTGGDFDIESFVVDKNQNIWVGDEFGPFILKFDSNGVLQQAPINTPNIDANGNLITPSNPEAPGDVVRSVNHPTDPTMRNDPGALRGSRGYEGMAFSPDGQTLYPMLEGNVDDDPVGFLRVYQIDTASGDFTDFIGFYVLEPEGGAIGDFTPINENEFLVLERDGSQNDPDGFKKVFKIDITNLVDGQFVKEEVVDLLNIKDPDDLDGDGEDTFVFTFVTIEDLLVLDENTILVANDNNYPNSIGRDYPDTPDGFPGIDNNEIIVITLDETLNLDPRLGAIPAPTSAVILAFGLLAAAGLRRRA